MTRVTVSSTSELLVLGASVVEAHHLVSATECSPIRAAASGSFIRTRLGVVMKPGFALSGVSVALSFLAACATPAQSSKPQFTLGGTSWQLVRFQQPDGTTAAPDDKAKYTFKFESNGRMSLRLDCNRGGSTWKSAGPGQLELGPLALTKALCPGSLHDQIVADWSRIRSYSFRNGTLFLPLEANGGTYEFELMESTTGTSGAPTPTGP